MPVTESTLQQYIQQLKESFQFFLKEIWRFRNLPTPCRVQLDIAEWLATGPKKRGVIAWRGSAKTWMTSAYICWRWLNNPELKILLVYGNEDKGKDTLRMCRDWLDMIPFLRHLAPSKGRVDNTERFDLGCCGKGDRTTSMTAVGIDGTLPGARAGLIIADDVEHPKNTITHDMRVKLRDKVTELENILLPGGDIIYLGTYHHLESLYDALQKGDPDRNYKPYRFRNWPIQYPTPELTTPILAPMIAKDLREGRATPGEPTWPERFSREHIQSLVMSNTKFNQQYMGFQNAADVAQFPLKLSDFIVSPVNTLLAPIAIQWGKMTSRGPTTIEDIASVGYGDDQFYGPCMVSDQWIPYVGTKAFLDPAGTGEDEMAWAIGGQLHGYIFTKSLQAVKGGPTEANLDKLVADLKTQRCHELYVEKNFGGEGLIRLLEMTIAKHAIRPEDKNEEFPNGWSCAVTPIHSSGQKEPRIIDALEPVLNHHRLVIPPEIAKDQTLMQQVVAITRERNCLDHDDRIEALSGMVAQFNYALAQNPTKQAEEQAQRQREEALKKYYQQFNTNPIVTTWSGLN